MNSSLVRLPACPAGPHTRHLPGSSAPTHPGGARDERHRQTVVLAVVLVSLVAVVIRRAAPALAGAIASMPMSAAASRNIIVSIHTLQTAGPATLVAAIAANVNV